jgi:hypothetical protein
MATPVGDEDFDSPRHLYKYRSLADLNRVSRTFSHHEIYLSSRIKFNDPFDCRPQLTMEGTRQQFRSYIDRVFRNQRPDATSRERKTAVAQILRRRSDVKGEIFAGLLKDLDDFLDRSVGILCLSSKPDDILMWTHYADAHTGICLQFARDAPNSVFAKALPVRYQASYPACSIVTTPRDLLSEIAVYTKALGWRCEREWRFVDGTGPGVRRFDSRLLTGVILGARLSHENRATVIEWVQTHPTPVQLFDATLAKYKFGIDLKPVQTGAELR